MNARPAQRPSPEVGGNWPDDLQVSGNHAVWPIEAREACRRSSGHGHYCTLAKGHRGDHLTLLERWPEQSDEPTT